MGRGRESRREGWRNRKREIEMRTEIEEPLEIICESQSADEKESIVEAPE